MRKGGLLLTVMDTADLAVSSGFTPGLSVARAQRLRIVGSVVRSKMVDTTSPIAYGYTDNLALWCDNGPIFNVSNSFGGAADVGSAATMAATGRPGAAPRTIPTCRRDAPACDAAREPQVERGRRCRSPRSSCATAST